MFSLSPCLRSGLKAFALGGAALPTHAFIIDLDFSHDTYFGGNATALATLEKAASDVSWALTTSLSALTQDQYAFSFGGTTATADFRVTYTNPSTGGQETLNTFDFAEDTFRIYVGGRNLLGSTLGQGGPGGSGVQSGASGSLTNLQGALDGLAATASAGMTRGGPVKSTLGVTLNEATQTYETGFILGNLWFDTDTDNNSVTDDASQFESKWHLDYSTPVASGKSDLYSVAVHEILHAVGIGTVDGWSDQVSGQDWLGSAVIDLVGSGVGLIDSGGSHIENGIMGTPIIDGILQVGETQEVVMDPNLTTGTRKYLTDLDLAFLADIGWEVQDLAAVPEPSAYALWGGFAVLGLAMWRRRYGRRR